MTPYRTVGEKQRSQPAELIALGSSILGWLALLAALVLLDDARPVSFAMDRRFFGVSRRVRWDPAAVDAAFWCLSGALFASLIAMVCSLLGDRPRKPRVSSVLLTLCSAGGWLAHLLKFG